MPLILDWAAGEGWNPGVHDAECFYAADPDGFLLGERAGTPVSCISVVTYPENFAFLGFYIVHPAFRGCGYGLKTWLAGMRRLTGYNVGLDGIVAQQANYVKSDFILAWRNIRYAGTVEGLPPAGGRAGKIVPMTAVSFAALQDYDRRHFPAPRPTFLHLWVTRPGTTALALVRDGHVAGYGVIRPAHTGFKIGPLFADDDEGAEALFRALAVKAGPTQISIDPPEPNLAAMRLAELHGLKPVFETARMYTGPAPEMSLREVFGITSFELG
ncbi:MAG TPA: GNAT family N-acetyltransferase [Alphaproteobacteria bacterium]